MRCKKTRLLLSDLYNGELDRPTEAAIDDHLEQCAECREVKREYWKAMESVAGAGLPELPEGFSSRVHMGLAREAEAMRKQARRTGTAPRLFGWRSVLQKGLLVLSGAAAMWLVGLAIRGTAEHGIVHGIAEHTQPQRSTQSQGERPAPAPQGRAGSVPVETVAVLTLNVHSKDKMEDVKFEVVLPDGVAFVGHSSKILQERVMTWHADLDAGENVVRIPIRAQRVGKWLLTARASKGRFRFVSEKFLVVTRPRQAT